MSAGNADTHDDAEKNGDATTRNWLLWLNLVSGRQVRDAGSKTAEKNTQRVVLETQIPDLAGAVFWDCLGRPLVVLAFLVPHKQLPPFPLSPPKLLLFLQAPCVVVAFV